MIFMDLKEVNKIFIDLVTMYTNAISECDSYEVPDKNKAYMYIGTMIGLKEFRDAASHRICLEQKVETNSEKINRELIPVTESEVEN